jgi:hypothetical protein
MPDLTQIRRVSCSLHRAAALLMARHRIKVGKQDATCLIRHPAVRTVSRFRGQAPEVFGVNVVVLVPDPVARHAVPVEVHVTVKVGEPPGEHVGRDARENLINPVPGTAVLKATPAVRCG